jgi:predicted CXXCH cytochrome family protein
VSCHDPHVGPSATARLIKSVPHKPFAQRKCADCHGATRTGATVAEPPELCLKCHPGQRAWLSAPVVHAPLRTRQSCLSCHGPHAGEGASILTRREEKLCFGCHDPKPFQRKTVHAALERGCDSCHDPHSAGRRGLLREDVNPMCLECHSDMSRHFHKTSGVTDPRTDRPLTCVGCHLPHSSDEKALLSHEGTRELCLQCHDPTMAPRPKK